MKKKIGNSVIRNKIKRKLKSAVQKILQKKSPIDLDYTYVIFGKNNIYLAGDCGAFQGRFTYSKTVYEGNTFICSGIGSNWANNVVDLNTLEPIFFDINGETVSHSCKTKKGSLKNIIEFCLPNHINAKKLWKLL